MDKDGFVIYGKSNDYRPSDLLRNISADIEFIRNGKVSTGSHDQQAYCMLCYAC